MSAKTPFGDGIAGRTRRGAGEPVLWIHGYTLDSRIWDPLWDLLPEFEHLGVDLPGHGRSRALAASDDLPALADRIAEIARERGARRLVALSLGTLVALEMTIRHPRAFDAVVLAAPTIGGGAVDPDAQRRNAELRRLYRERGAGPWMTELWMRSPPPIFAGAARSPRLWSDLKDVIDAHAWRELGDHAMQRLTEKTQTARELAAAESRFTVIVGDDDMPVFLRAAHLLSRRLARCAVVHLAETGHLSLLERPAACAEIVREALANGPPRR